VLDETVRAAARQMLAVAPEGRRCRADIDAHAEEVDENGRRPVVATVITTNAELITAAGPVPMRGAAGQ
jgi:putative transposase